MDSLKSLAGVQTQTGLLHWTMRPMFLILTLWVFPGSFFLDWDGQWKVISNQNIKVEFDIYNNNNYIIPFIEFMPNTNNTKRYQDVIKGFTLIDDEGYRYTFGRYSFLNGNVHTGQNAIEYSISFLQQYSWVAGQNPFFNEWIATAWHMTKVEDFNMNTIFELSYERSYFTAQLYNTLYVQENFCSDADGWLSASHGNSNTVEGDYQANGALISNSYLKEIKSNKGEQLEFIRSNAIQKKFDWNFQFATYTQFVLCPLIQCVDNYPYPFLQYPGYYSFNPQQALSNPLNGLMWMKLDTIIYRKNYIGQNTYIINGIKLEYNNNANERLNLQSVHIIGNDILTNSNANKHSYVMEYNNFISYQII
ncbi:MAG: hypothetical protein IPJ13_22845 [Saprospiraceae bacterium]|nr:hypothetical protein [Saprospiraceae bacterium]